MHVTSGYYLLSCNVTVGMHDLVAGRATGEAYVMFCDAAQASSAMENCNKKYLGSRYIE
jgi:hypothetical protein